MTIIDVSKWNGDIAWDRVAAAGVELAIIKATGAEIGKCFTDSKFAQNWRGAADAGIKRGAYHFLNASMSGADQAAYFMDVLQSNGGFSPGELLPVVDCEWPKEPAQANAANIEEFVTAIRDTMEANTIIYTGGWWWTPMPGEKDFASDCPLWLAAYTPTLPKPPQPWSNVALWQKSDKGLVDGIPGRVDINELIGDLEGLTL